MRQIALLGTLTTGLAVCAGCASDHGEPSFSESIWNPFGLKLPFAADEEPIRIGVVANANGLLDVRAWWDLSDHTPWTELRRQLAAHTHRPVQITQLELFQIPPHLESGWLAFALLSDEQCAQVRAEGAKCHTIARASALQRTGLIVAKADSNIRSIQDIAGRRFAFGPRGDPVLHYAAAAALNAGGVRIDKIRRELVPINTLQYHLNSQEVAKEVAFGTTPAGVIDRADFERFPETGGRLFPLKISKDRFRVLGETRPVDVGPFVASLKTDPKLVASVREFLLSAGRRRPAVTASLGIAGFTGVDPAPGPAPSAQHTSSKGR